jgi:hypothetical protein
LRRSTIARVADLVEYGRIINTAVLMLTLVILGARVNRWWCTRWRCLLPAAGTAFIALFVALGTVDAMLHNRPGGMSVLFVLLASIALLMQALTVGLGRSHTAGHAPGSYVAFDPAKGEPCAPGDATC